MTPAAAFDRVAATYDELWTHAPSGWLQRDAFWNKVDPYFRNAARVLDIGCGTGDDALRLMQAGTRVTAIDISPEMVVIARSRGVDARVLPAEQLAQVEGRFDVVMSNFGALNCVSSLASIRAPLAEKLVSGGWLVLCLLNRFCAWEIAWFLLKGEPRQALRRWRGKARTSAGLDVYYPTVGGVRRQLFPEFTLIARYGLGIAVPPSYVSGLSQHAMHCAARIDASISSMPGARALGDHVLFIFRRSSQ